MAFVTNPTSLISSSVWYRIADLAALFGVSIMRMEAILGSGGYDRVQGGRVLNWIATMGGSGSPNWIDSSLMTTQSVATFQALTRAVE